MDFLGGEYNLDEEDMTLFGIDLATEHHLPSTSTDNGEYNETEEMRAADGGWYSGADSGSVGRTAASSGSLPTEFPGAAVPLPHRGVVVSHTVNGANNTAPLAGPATASVGPSGSTVPRNDISYRLLPPGAANKPLSANVLVDTSVAWMPASESPTESAERRQRYERQIPRSFPQYRHTFSTPIFGTQTMTEKNIATQPEALGGSNPGELVGVGGTSLESVNAHPGLPIFGSNSFVAGLGCDMMSQQEPMTGEPIAIPIHHSLPTMNEPCLGLPVGGGSVVSTVRDCNPRAPPPSHGLPTEGGPRLYTDALLKCLLDIRQTRNNTGQEHTPMAIQLEWPKDHIILVVRVSVGKRCRDIEPYPRVQREDINKIWVCDVMRRCSPLFTGIR